MRPTRRGYAVVVVVAGAVAAGAVFGARALDAVVLPGVVALVAAAVQLRRTSAPGVDRAVPPAEIAGTQRTITLVLDGSRGVPATVRDRLPAGVDAVAESSGDRSRSAAGHAVIDAAIGGEEASYEIVPRRRGAHEVGPARVVVTDVLGLLRRRFAVDARDTLLAYPRVGTLPTAVRTELRAAYLSHDATRRDEFDDLREYVRGDALRDVHWKSSARHDELMIMEFADRSDPDQVTVAAGVADGAAADVDSDGTVTDAGVEDATTDDDVAAATPADGMADAAATVCVSLVRAGASVALATPSGRVTASPGRIRPALDHLATAAGGRVPIPDADVVVAADTDGVSVRFDGRSHRIEGPIGDTVPIGAGAGSVGSDAAPAESGSVAGVGDGRPGGTGRVDPSGRSG